MLGRSHAPLGGIVRWCIASFYRVQSEKFGWFSLSGYFSQQRMWRRCHVVVLINKFTWVSESYSEHIDQWQLVRILRAILFHHQSYFSVDIDVGSDWHGYTNKGESFSPYILRWLICHFHSTAVESLCDWQPSIMCSIIILSVVATRLRHVPCRVSLLPLIRGILAIYRIGRQLWWLITADGHFIWPP